jgi:hypothetical protein
MVDRRVVNKPRDTEKRPDVQGSENIVAKEQPRTIEDRVASIEKYIHAIDPVVRDCIGIADFKLQITQLHTQLNDELSRVTGVQVRSNNYIEKKFTEIDQALGAIINAVKELQTNYNDLFSDEDLKALDEESGIDKDNPDLFEEDKDKKNPK